MTTDLAVSDAPANLFGADNPALLVRRATDLANVLAGVIEEKRLYATIRGQRHVRVEGWTLLGSMLGVFAHIEWSRRLPDGWEAHAVVRTFDGHEVGAADGQCTWSEEHWRGREDYSLRSMAQTRAVSKALRMPLGYIVQLAGFNATPAEEMGPDESEPATPPRQRRSPRPTQDELRRAIRQAADARGIAEDGLAALAKEAGVEGKATVAQLRAILALVEAYNPAPEAIEDEEPPDDPYG